MKLDQYLRERKLTQQKLADKLGVKQQTVSQWISGTRPQYRYMIGVHDFTRGKVSFKDWI